MAIVSRRGFLTGLISFAAAAPAIVRAASIMPVKPVVIEPPIFAGAIGEYNGVILREDRYVVYMHPETFEHFKNWVDDGGADRFAAPPGAIVKQHEVLFGGGLRVVRTQLIPVEAPTLPPEALVLSKFRENGDDA